MLEINDGLRPFAPQRSQPPPAYQNSRQMPQWPQPSAVTPFLRRKCQEVTIRPWAELLGNHQEVHRRRGQHPGCKDSMQDSHPRCIFRLSNGLGRMCIELLAGMTLRPPDLKGRICPMGSVGCHNLENRMHGTTFANSRMGQDCTVRHLIIRTARHTWRCKALQ